MTARLTALVATSILVVVLVAAVHLALSGLGGIEVVAR